MPSNTSEKFKSLRKGRLPGKRPAQQLCSDDALQVARGCRNDFCFVTDGGDVAQVCKKRQHAIPFIPVMVLDCRAAKQLWGQWPYTSKGELPRGSRKAQETLGRTSELQNWLQFSKFCFLPNFVRLSVAFIADFLIGVLFNCLKGCFS